MAELVRVLSYSKLRLAYAAKADALVTGDADLLALAGQSKIPILTPDALRERL